MINDKFVFYGIVDSNGFVNYRRYFLFWLFQHLSTQFYFISVKYVFIYIYFLINFFLMKSWLIYGILIRNKFWLTCSILSEYVLIQIKYATVCNRNKFETLFLKIILSKKTIAFKQFHFPIFYSLFYKVKI